MKPFDKKCNQIFWILAPVIFAIFLFIYWRSCCRTVFWWDSAELTAAVATSGVPHPPGFPFYLLLGKIFSMLPFYSLSFKLNLLSGMFSALSLMVFFYLGIQFYQILSSAIDIDKDKSSIVLSSLLTLLVAGLNYAFWIQGVRAEVYSLNGLLFVLLFFCSLRFVCSKEKNSKSLRWLYLFFFLFGLGMGNHNITLLSTLPAFLFLFIHADFRKFFQLKNLAFYLFFFILGCSVYLYLPFRAINFPALNWGNPVTPSSILSTVLALKSFKQIGFTLDYTLWERIKDVWLMIYSQFTFLPFVLSLLGLFFLLKKSQKFLLFFFLLLIGNSLTLIVLPSEFISTSLDFQGYILPTIFSLGLLFGLGIFISFKRLSECLRVKEFSLGFRKSLTAVFTLFFFSISLLPFLTFHQMADLSLNDLAQRYGAGLLSQIKKDAVLFIDNPNLYFILCALKYAEGYRKDVAVLDRGLLKAKWYCEQERRKYPELFSGVPEDLIGEDLFLSLMSKAIDKDIAVYMEFTENDSELVKFLLPSGYLFRVEKEFTPELPKEVLATQKEFEKEYSLQKEEKIFQNDFDAQRMFVFNTYRWGLFYEKRGRVREAINNFSLALELDPSNSELQSRMQRLKNRIQIAKFEQ